MDNNKLLQFKFNRKATTQGATSRHTGNYKWRACPRSLYTWRL